MPTIVTHEYEFPSANPIATFGAGWTLVGSVTRPLFFKVGSSLDDIIAQFNSWQDVGTEAPLTKRIVLHQIEYTRLYGTDVVTITYPMISSDAGPVIVVTGSATTIERAAFASGTIGTRWVVTNRVHHAVVTLTATTSRKRHTSTNPRFLCGLEAIDYVRTPGSIDIPPPPVTVPGAPVNIFAELVLEIPGVPDNVVVTPLTATSASVSFTAPLSNGGSAITSYTVTSTPDNITATGAVSPIVVTGLTTGASYTFTVHATNVVGDGPESATVGPIVLIAGESDPDFANVSLLLHGHGTNGSTLIIDSGPGHRAMNVSGNVAISTTQSKFGGSSLYFNNQGNPGRIEVHGVSDPNYFYLEYGIALAAFTIEFFYKPIDENNDYFVITNRDYTLPVDVAVEGAFAMTATHNSLTIHDSVQLGGVDISTSGVPANAGWRHYAVSRGAEMKLFIDGIEYYSGAPDVNYNNSFPLVIGSWDYANGARGYVDELRITRGVCRYNTNFNPPTAPFPDQ